MANLFNNNILKDKLQNFEIPKFDEKLAIIKQWQETYKKGTLQQMTESEVEQSYNEDILGKILGYTKFPTIPYTRQPQPKTEVTGQKPDFGLGFYYQDSEKKDKTLAVIEVKDAKTDINKSQKREGNLSPIQQGFKYKPQYSDCRWVIVSNFFDTKLFVDTMIDYEYWTLDTLVDDTDNYFQFRKFYYLLCADNLIKETGKSKTEELLSAVRIQEEKITKEFYKEYKGLRATLIQDLKKNNTDVNIEILIAKAQKIIDRMVFIHFCEDNGLLPQNKTKAYVERAKEFDFEPWELLQRVFKGIDKGSEKLEISAPGYNGGLFAYDDILDNLKVSDTICQKFIDLGRYDFAEDLSVNILGHIFEQSISDLEELREEYVEGDKETVSKRKKDGIFYTPEYIVDYIVTNSLGKYLEEKFDECSKQNKNEFKLYQTYQKILQNVKVLDPACGSGAFLVKVFDFLLEENKRVMNILSGGSTGMFDINSMSKDILQNNIFGVDLNAESVEITKLSLWLKTAQKGKKLATLDNNVKCGNSLIDDPEVAGDKAFDWNVEFKSIMDDGGFDVIVGNPPYVAGKDLPQNQKIFFKSNYKQIIGKFDLYLLFVEKALSLVKKNGFTSLIIPNTILVNENAMLIREFLIKNKKISYIRFFSDKIFSEANVESVILTTHHNDGVFPVINNEGEEIISMSNIDILSDSSYRFQVTMSDRDKKILEKIGMSEKLGEIVDICIGIQIGGAGNSKDFKEKYMDKEKRDETFKKCLDGKDFEPFYTNWHNKYVSYGSWLHRKRNEKFFLNPKIMIRQIGATPVCHIDFKEYYTLNTIYNAIIINKDFDIKYVFLLMNSKCIKYFWLKRFSDGKSLFPKVKKSQLVDIPIKKISLSDQEPFIKKADQMLAMNKEFQEKINFILKFVQQKYNIEKLSTKLKKFYDHDFLEFKKQLKIKKLSIEDERELMAMFDKDKTEILKLKDKIDATDKEINEMVFELYGLSEEEREVVLDG